MGLGTCNIATVFAVLIRAIFCYRLLGYRYNENGEVEKQDIFLKRMSGIMRLYAAVLITRPCRYQQNKSHPHGLSQAWRWVSCILNMSN
jgi:nucleoporin GLE1